MNEQVKNNYFLITRLIMMVVISVCCIVSAFSDTRNEAITQTGISVWIFLIVALYMAAVTVKELVSIRIMAVLMIFAMVMVGVLYYIAGRGFLILGIFTIYEIFCCLPGLRYGWYFLPIALSVIDSPLGVMFQLVTSFLMMVIYLQHNIIVKEYEKRMMEDTVLEQGLKRDMREQEYAAKAELKRNVLQAENQILEERASLSQTLHDKLGHSINGSVYQLEGVKVLMDKEPEKAKGMIQGVIDQLRGGMDEIRAILRKERPQKRELAMIQLYKLCEDCNSKGVETELHVEGEVAVIPENVWEVILDNAFEAVSNSMKYARCKHIDINIVVMNKMVRCSIIDDGIGCENIQDGMGISGMRRRIRDINGTLDFDTTAGFGVTMLMPI